MRPLALVVAGYPLYLVANYYPMSLQDQFGTISQQTISYGVYELLKAGFWPLAAIIFLASIFIPLAKLLGMSWLLWSAHHGSTTRLVLKTRLYRFIEGVGRWSNIDIFTIVIFLPIMQIAGIINVSAGQGAPAFLAVIVLTMLAVRMFDPRLLWDHIQPLEHPNISTDERAEIRPGLGWKPSS